MNENVPFIVFEGQMARNERQIKRLVIALIVAIVLMFASNAIWLYAWCQYDYGVTESVDLNATEGNANYIGNDGEITNGTYPSNKDLFQKEKE